MISKPSIPKILLLRLLILFGLFSIIYFFVWFFDPELINNSFLFYSLAVVFVFDSGRILYVWYHYWMISIPKKPQSNQDFTIDVLTTYFPGEPKNMVKKTLEAILALEGAHTTYLCDEANDPELRKFCAENGIKHVTRDNRIDAKAGNINNALKQATGDLCLILDPDHIPRKNFLVDTKGYFANPDIGFVQTVQGYYNISESLVARAAAEQTYQFYGPLMMGMNAYGTVNAIGANCFFRRAALDSIGGHAAGLSEDMHTAMKLHAQGWKSVYVPEVYTLGKVPTTLKSYYKQQLKWSRGTMELFVTTYPKIFRKLSWRQKFHYGIIPFHYLTGFIVLLCILIPIISLLFSTTAWHGSIINFGFIVTPILVSVLGIRYFSQQWLKNPSERGLHIRGGLLMQCTWWVYILAFIYTIFRVKVPYLPTKKSSEYDTDYKILLPNLIASFLSLLVIPIGLIRDFTPFSIIMAMFALWNASILISTLKFAKKPLENPKKPFPFNTALDGHIWSLKNKIFASWKVHAIWVTVLLVGCSIYLQYQNQEIRKNGYEVPVFPKMGMNFLGVFSPRIDNGLSELEEVSKFESRIDQKVNIISEYIPWDINYDKSELVQRLKAIHDTNALPLITWEPWLNTFQDSLKDSISTFEFIVDGRADDYIISFAQTIESLNMPVFIRYAHEFDNPTYPWYNESSENPDNFKAAWVYIHELFKAEHVQNVVWVYNPWQPQSIEPYFPGNDYVDWYGANILNYSVKKEQNHSFKNLYIPFAQEYEKLPEKPVMVCELGTLGTNSEKQNWLSDAFSYISNQKMSSIRALVFFNSDRDNNLPATHFEGESGYLNWKISDSLSIRKPWEIDNSFPYKKLSIKTHQRESADSVAGALNEIYTYEKDLPPLNIGVNLKNGQGWQKDFYVLTREKLTSDFSQMREAGIKRISYIESENYDYNLLQLSEEFNMEVSYSFWLPENVDFLSEKEKSKRVKSHILDRIQKLKGNSNISNWALQNDMLSKIPYYFSKPYAFGVQNEFLVWLKDLVKSIRKIDPNRNIYVDVDVNMDVVNNLRRLDGILHKDVRYGLRFTEDGYPEDLFYYLEENNTDFIISDINLKSLKNIAKKMSLDTKTIFINTWQDKHDVNFIDFSGLVDYKGRPKPDFYKVGQLIKGNNNNSSTFPQVKILKPSIILGTNYIFNYHALIWEGNKWAFLPEEEYKIEWFLVKCDKLGRYVGIEKVGDSPTIELQIPADYQSYRLHVSVVGENLTMQHTTILNTPYFK